MLSGTVRAVLMSWVTIRKVAPDLGVQVDDQLVEVRRAHRVEARVGLVEQDDLGVEHQGAGQAGPLAHTAGDLTGQLRPRRPAGRPARSSPRRSSGSRTRTSWCARAAGRRCCRRAIIEPKSAPSWNSTPNSLRTRTARARAAAARPGRRSRRCRGPGVSRPTSVLRKTDLPVPDGPEQHRDLSGRQGQRDVLPDDLRAEALGQPLDRDLDAHTPGNEATGRARLRTAQHPLVLAVRTGCRRSRVATAGHRPQHPSSTAGARPDGGTT